MSLATLEVDRGVRVLPWRARRASLAARTTNVQAAAATFQSNANRAYHGVVARSGGPTHLTLLLYVSCRRLLGTAPGSSQAALREKTAKYTVGRQSKRPP
jgi:hypothetical protein